MFAIANAEHSTWDVENLYVSEAYVNEGPTIKQPVHVLKVQLHKS